MFIVNQREAGKIIDKQTFATFAEAAKYAQRTQGEDCFKSHSFEIKLASRYEFLREKKAERKRLGLK